MRLTADEVAFLIQSVENITIKGKDALVVAKIHQKLTKEFERLIKVDSK